MIALRLVLLACLCLIVAVRAEAYQDKLTDAETTNLSSRISAVLAAQGVASWGQQVSYEDSLRAEVVEFQPAGCDAAAKVIPFSITLNSEAFLAMNDVQDWPVEMAHLESREQHLSQAHLVFSAVRAMALNVLGIKGTRANRQALIIAAPPGCEAAFDIDLRAVWDEAA